MPAAASSSRNTFDIVTHHDFFPSSAVVFSKFYSLYPNDLFLHFFACMFVCLFVFKDFIYLRERMR